MAEKIVRREFLSRAASARWRVASVFEQFIWLTSATPKYELKRNVTL